MCESHCSSVSQSSTYTFYLEAAIVGAEFLSQHSVICIEGFLLQTAVHQNMNDLSLLRVLQAHPSQRANKKL